MRKYVWFILHGTKKSWWIRRKGKKGRNKWNHSEKKNKMDDSAVTTSLE